MSALLIEKDAAMKSFRKSQLPGNQSQSISDEDD